jgi:hypothetical protein
MKVMVQYPRWWVEYEELQDDIDKIYLSQTDEAFTELNFCHKAKYPKLERPPHMIRYDNVHLVDLKELRVCKRRMISVTKKLLSKKQIFLGSCSTRILTPSSTS